MSFDLLGFILVSILLIIGYEVNSSSSLSPLQPQPQSSSSAAAAAVEAASSLSSSFKKKYSSDGNLLSVSQITVHKVFNLNDVIHAMTSSKSLTTTTSCTPNIAKCVYVCQLTAGCVLAAIGKFGVSCYLYKDDKSLTKLSNGDFVLKNYEARADLSMFPDNHESKLGALL
ncbi:hypothetical protein HELRODRAFT_160012 [Helobdella robusta]|uniref:Apple domain-containing protein n=1 Tax=Helobdella robusta TaxID=6412 RepID=T1EPN6_HELRO|nr:hypothetical protein HELRODRAFT_160012 [Helobdella robusta]ESO05919.1 hypothetical protein HELRODRAFT_160012 [Helobdella robusta]